MSVEPTLWGMYWPTEKPFEFLDVTQGDMNRTFSVKRFSLSFTHSPALLVASIAFGWTLGFGYFAVCHAVRESRRSRRINTYVVLIWGEVLVCVAPYYRG